MNQFIFVVQTKDRKVHIGTLQADSGDDANILIKDRFPEWASYDLKGVTSKKYTAHEITCKLETNRGASDVFLNMLQGAGYKEVPLGTVNLHPTEYMREKVDVCDDPKEEMRVVLHIPDGTAYHLGEGTGYSHFGASFYFDASGRLVSHGVYE